MTFLPIDCATQIVGDFPVVRLSSRQIVRATVGQLVLAVKGEIVMSPELDKVSIVHSLPDTS